MPDAEQVERLIQSAFPPAPFSGHITSGCDCDECVQLERSLKNLSWQDISDDVMDVQFGFLPLLSPEALQAFLPA
jgi:hypothetical protein